MMRALPFVTLALLTALAACSGAASTALPQAAAAGPPQARAVLAHLVIKVPASKHRRRGHYVSPATTSLAYSIDAAAQTPIAISTSNPNCTLTVQKDLQCSVNFSVKAGVHAFSFTAEDAKSTPLSANTSTAFDVKKGKANRIAVTLGGIAHSLQVRSASTFGVTGSQETAFAIAGNAPQLFDLVALDADGYTMVGPGAPQPIVAATPESMKVTPASSAAPNTVTLTSTYSATNDPTITHASSLKITATPVPNSGGSTVTATIPLTLSQPWIYAADNVNKDVEAFDEQGHAKTLAHPITGMNDPFGVVYDYGNGLLYVADYGANTVTAYHPDGTPYALSAPLPFAGLNGPAGLEYDPTTNSIYVVSFAYGSGTVSAFDEQGNPKDISGFGGINAAYAITHNPNNDWFYVANCTSATTQPSVPTIPPGSITTYDAQGVAQSTSGGFPNLDNPDAIAYDAHNGWLYIGNDMTPSLFGTIAAYDEQGHQQTLAGNPSGIPTGWGLAYDQNNGSIYVAVDSVDESTPTIWSYDEAGFKQTTAGTFPGLGWPAEISVVP